jgi:hypothetical protein
VTTLWALTVCVIEQRYVGADLAPQQAMVWLRSAMFVLECDLPPAPQPPTARYTIARAVTGEWRIQTYER